MNTPWRIFGFAVVVLSTLKCVAQSPAIPHILNQPVDVSQDFADFGNTYFFADKLVEFDPQTGEGKLNWKRNRLSTSYAFNKLDPRAATAPANIFPANEYEADPTLPISIEFVSPRTIRIRMVTRANVRKQEESLMLVKPPAHDASWKSKAVKGGYEYSSDFGRVTIQTNP